MSDDGIAAGDQAGRISQLVERNAELERKLSELDEELDELVAEQVEYLQNVSHQLVAPLNAIKWHIESLTGGRIGVERAKKVLRSIYSQSTIAVHLAKNFALMSNLDADHALTALKEPLQPVRLCALMINLADDFQPLGWDKDIQIEVEKEEFDGVPDVLAMKPLVSQAFSNIIENAVKYSNSATTVVIDGALDRKKDVVVVRVINKGIHLDDDAIEHVFERGYRSKAAKQRYPAGTGFGLYIARRIVELHEGKILAARDGAGRSVFSVALSVGGLEGKARERARKEDRSTNR